jgi:hypothetical protein
VICSKMLIPTTNDFIYFMFTHNLLTTNLQFKFELSGESGGLSCDISLKNENVQVLEFTTEQIQDAARKAAALEKEGISLSEINSRKNPNLICSLRSKAVAASKNIHGETPKEAVENRMGIGALATIATHGIIGWGIASNWYEPIFQPKPLPFVVDAAIMAGAGVIAKNRYDKLIKDTSVIEADLHRTHYSINQLELQTKTAPIIQDQNSSNFKTPEI